MRLASKERCGAKVKKTYQAAETPYRKLLRQAHLNKRQKQKLANEYNQLNPAELKRRIEALQEKLLKIAARTKQKIFRQGVPRCGHARSENSLGSTNFQLPKTEALGVDS